MPTPRPVQAGVFVSLTTSIAPRPAVQRFAPILTGVLAVVFLLASLAPFLVTAPQLAQLAPTRDGGPVAQAGVIELFCRDPLGANMHANYVWMSGGGSGTVAPDQPREAWTLQEAYGSVLIPTYYGEGGKGKFTIYDTDPDVTGQDEDAKKQTRAWKGLRSQLGLDDDKTGQIYNAIRGEYELLREWHVCEVQSTVNGLASAILGVSKALVAITQNLLTLAFTQAFFCKEAGQENCIDLIGIIGGGATGFSDRGWIGLLADAFFFVFSPVVIALQMVVALWNTVRHGRTAHGALLVFKVIVVFLLGVMIAYNPQKTAKGIGSVAQFLSTCVVYTATGGTCLDEGVSEEQVKEVKTKSEVCYSQLQGTNLFGAAENGVTTTVNRLVCQVWRQFVLEPYAHINFGMPYKELDTLRPGSRAYEILDGKGLLHVSRHGQTISPNEGQDPNAPAQDDTNKIKVDGNLFCVPLGGGGKTANDFRNKPLALTDSVQVCNVAAYQMYLQTRTPVTTEAHANWDGSTVHRFHIYTPEWWRVIGFASLDREVWDVWKPSSTKSLSAFGFALSSLAMSLFGLWFIVWAGFVGFMNYLLYHFHMAFFALFCLVALIKKDTYRVIFNWFSTLMQFIWRYAFIDLVIVIGLMFYQGVFLSVGDNAAATFVAILLINAVVWRYKSLFFLTGSNVVAPGVHSQLAARTDDYIYGDGATRGLQQVKHRAAGMYQNASSMLSQLQSFGQGGGLGAPVVPEVPTTTNPDQQRPPLHNEPPLHDEPPHDQPPLHDTPPPPHNEPPHTQPPLHDTPPPPPPGDDQLPPDQDQQHEPPTADGEPDGSGDPTQDGGPDQQFDGTPPPPGSGQGDPEPPTVQPADHLDGPGATPDPDALLDGKAPSGTPTGTPPPPPPGAGLPLGGPTPAGSTPPPPPNTTDVPTDTRSDAQREADAMKGVLNDLTGKQAPLSDAEQAARNQANAMNAALNATNPGEQPDGSTPAPDPAAPTAKTSSEHQPAASAVTGTPEPAPSPGTGSGGGSQPEVSASQPAPNVSLADVDTPTPEPSADTASSRPTPAASVTADTPTNPEPAPTGQTAGGMQEDRRPADTASGLLGDPFASNPATYEDSPAPQPDMTNLAVQETIAATEAPSLDHTPGPVPPDQPSPQTGAGPMLSPEVQDAMRRAQQHGQSPGQGDLPPAV